MAKAKAPAKKKTPAPRKKPRKPKALAKKRTIVEKAIRDQLIMERVAQEWPWKPIAEEAEVTVRRAQQIAKQMKQRGNPMLLRRNPAEIVEWALDQYQATAALYLLSASDARTTAESVGALKARDKNIERILALMQATGYLPRNLGTVRVQVEVEVMVEVTLDLISQLQSGELSPEDFRTRYLETLGAKAGQVPAIEGSGKQK